MAFWYTNDSGKTFQVVIAQNRWESVYAGKTGHYWHMLDANSEIVPSSITGPFDSFELAFADAKVK